MLDERHFELHALFIKHVESRFRYNKRCWNGRA
jgi:hypothetical protein